MAPDVATPAGTAHAGAGKPGASNIPDFGTHQTKKAPDIATPAGTAHAGAAKPGASSTTEFGHGRTPLSGSTSSGPGFSSSGSSGYKRYFNTSTNMGRFGLLMAVGAGALSTVYLYRRKKEQNDYQHATQIPRNKGVV